MPIGLARKLEFIVRTEGLDLDIQVLHVTLTKQQVIDYNLPSTPIKATDKRAERWRELMGRDATELDALEAIAPGTLERLLRNAIERFFDTTLAGRINAVMADIQRDTDAVNAEVHERHAPALAELETGRQIILAANAALEARAAPVMQQIADELAAEAPNADDYDWPEPRDGKEVADPL